MCPPMGPISYLLIFMRIFINTVGCQGGRIALARRGGGGGESSMTDRGNIGRNLPQFTVLFLSPFPWGAAGSV